MSPNLDSPVQTQMAVAVLTRSVVVDEYHGIKCIDGRPSGRRRIFVQTDTGFVLGIELDRGDSAHTVKKKLQVALNLPTEESSLTFGDHVLKNDLSAIRNDSPLLLTRNLMHRSSSTPCLSPRGKDSQQRDMSGPVEILGHLSRCSIAMNLVKSVVKAIKGGVDPLPIHNGLGGAYYFRNREGEKVAIVKPTDEEPFAPNNPKGFIGKALGQPGLKNSVRVGETGYREVAAYLLDHDHFANVPPTVLVKITHSMFNVNEDVCCSGSSKSPMRRPPISKIASFQQFIPHDYDASDHGTSSFPVASVHRIGILDIRIFNTDRHAGNLLVRKHETGLDRFGGLVELIPIDHGLCLPETLDDPYFEWIHWPQSSIPFSSEEMEYIANLDPARDADMLRKELPMMREACLRVLLLCTTFLKEAATFGLCLAEIGEMMSRQFTGREEEPSELEVVCMKARRLVSEREVSVLLPEADFDEDEIQFDIDCEETDSIMAKTPPGVRGASAWNPLSKLDESLEDEEEEEPEEDNRDARACKPSVFFPAGKCSLNAPKLSYSLKGVNPADKTHRHLGGFLKRDNFVGKANNSQGWSRSANEQLPVSASFVNLAEMGEEEWGAFFDKFLELIHAAFRGRKCRGGEQRLRLGTSCQF